MKRRVSLAIVTFHGYDKARDAIASILEHTCGVDLEIYVIDNASGDGTGARLKAEFPGITLVENAKNCGFGAGHNSVLPLLASDYHAVVNPDVLIDRDALAELAGFLDDNPDVGLVTPKILNLDGSDQELPKRDPTVLALLGRRAFKERLRDEVAFYQMKDKDLSQPTDIEFATGCFFIMRTALFKEIGGFDTRFFMYYEDMDITRRARQKMRAVYDPGTYIYHAWERSSAHSLKYFLILVAGMFKYFFKWGFRFSNKKERKAAKFSVNGG